MDSRRGNIDPFEKTVEIPLRLMERCCDIFVLLDERHQVGRIGYRMHRGKVPVVTVGHKFALEVGGWYNSSEYWGEFLTQSFAFRRSPENEADKNAIMITSARRKKFLGYLSRELSSIIAPLADSGLCGLSGFAGHITVEISKKANLSVNARQYLEWLEESLRLYKDGISPDELPACPISPEDMKLVQ